MSNYKFSKIFSYSLALALFIPSLGLCSSPDGAIEIGEQENLTPSISHLGLEQPNTQDNYQSRKKQRSALLTSPSQLEKYSQELYSKQIEALQNYLFNEDNFTEDEKNFINTFCETHKPTYNAKATLPTKNFWPIILAQYVSQEIVEPNNPAQIALEARPKLIYNLIRFLSYQDESADKCTALDPLSVLIRSHTIASKTFFEMLTECADKDLKNYNEVIMRYAAKAKAEDEKSMLELEAMGF